MLQHLRFSSCVIFIGAPELLAGKAPTGKMLNILTVWTILGQSKSKRSRLVKCQALFFSPTTIAAPQFGENVTQEPPAVLKRDRHQITCTPPFMIMKALPLKISTLVWWKVASMLGLVSGCLQVGGSMVSGHLYPPSIKKLGHLKWGWVKPVVYLEGRWVWFRWVGGCSQWAGQLQERSPRDCWLLCILTIFQFVFNLSISFLHSRPTV